MIDTAGNIHPPKDETNAVVPVENKVRQGGRNIPDDQIEGNQGIQIPIANKDKNIHIDRDIENAFITPIEFLSRDRTIEEVDMEESQNDNDERTIGLEIRNQEEEEALKAYIVPERTDHSKSSHKRKKKQQDSLPVIEGEIMTGSTIQEKKKRLFISLCAAIMITIGIVAIATGMTFCCGSPHSSSSELFTVEPSSADVTDVPTVVGTEAATDTPTLLVTSERFLVIRNIVERELPEFLSSQGSAFANITDPANLFDPTSPQFKAVQWLAEEDEFLQYPINFTKFSEGMLFAGRYGLVVFYFSTTSRDSEWRDLCNFMNPETHHCDWNCNVPSILFEAPSVPDYPDSPTIAEMMFLNEDDILGVTCLKDLNPNPAYQEWWNTIWSIELVYNNLSGSIPVELGAAAMPMSYMRFPFNSLFGSIPFDSFSPFTSWIDFHSNELAGTLPTTIGRLGNIGVLQLYQNKLEGTLPSEIGQLKTMKLLEVDSNHLTGKIPTEVAELSELITLKVSHNMLTGSIPSQLLYGTVYSFWGEGNIFSGRIPEAPFQNATSKSQTLGPRNMTYLALDKNQLRGTIPSSLEQLTKLEYLALDANALIGTIPSALSSLSRLETLSFSQNSLNGTVLEDESFLWELRDLKHLFIGQNEFSGTISSRIGQQVPNLKIFEARENQLTGELPSEIGFLQDIVAFSVAQNNLFGPIPEEAFFYMADLRRLILSGNAFTGTLSQFCNIGNSLSLVGQFFLQIEADCDEVDCPCCTQCCFDSQPDQCDLN